MNFLDPFMILLQIAGLLSMAVAYPVNTDDSINLYLGGTQGARPGTIEQREKPGLRSRVDSSAHPLRCDATRHSDTRVLVASYCPTRVSALDHVIELCSVILYFIVIVSCAFSYLQEGKATR